MTTDCKVTVLVAVYNAAPYLAQCLDSLLSQTLADLQVVCVDDASTDDSWHILQQYRRRDARIDLVRLDENHGQAHARNCGLRLARGRYVCFLDSDDWMDSRCLELAVQTFETHAAAGCVLLRTIYYYSEQRQEPYAMQPFECLAGYEAFVKSLTWQIHGVYMVRADIHHRYPYDESAHAFSDDNTTRLHYLASQEVRQCDGTYYYRQRADSVSHHFGPRRFDYLAANASMKRTLLGLGVDNSVVDIYENHRWLNVVDLYMLFYRHRRSLSPAEAAEALHGLRTAWASIEAGRLRPATRYKFGYMPLQCSWLLFRLQEELYFGLRALLGR